MRPLALVATAALLAAAPARADAPQVFGFGARSASLARADLASDDAAGAARGEPALAAAPGLRVRLGYGYSGLGLTVGGKDAGVGHASGVDFAGQYGARVGGGVELGFALALHLPDPYLAKVAFRPATEPQFVLYEAALQRTSFDLVAALRYGRVSIGGGAALGLTVGGNGTQFNLGQDAHGTHADGAVDVALPYRFAPLVGARVDLGRVVVAASFRGAMALDLSLDNKANIALTGNPLNGDTTVRVRGTSGYDPWVVTLGARVALWGGLSAMGSLEVTRYSDTPPPVADVTIDVRLGTTPGQREARFIEPRFRDTIAPRLGLELRRPSEGERRWAARVGYAVLPSPVPRQSGLTTYADATRHQLALGGGYRLGRLAGVELAVEAAGQLHLLAPRTEDKDSPALPYAHFDVGGKILHGALSLEATW